MNTQSKSKCLFHLKHQCNMITLDTPSSPPMLSSILSTLFTTPGYSTHTRLVSDRTSVAVFPDTTAVSLLSPSVRGEVGLFVIVWSIFTRFLLDAYAYRKSIFSIKLCTWTCPLVKIIRVELQASRRDVCSGSLCACAVTISKHGGREPLKIFTIKSSWTAK